MAALPTAAHVKAEEAYAFSSADFERVRRLIHLRAGIALNATKRSMVYSRLSRRLRQLGLDDFGAYLDALEATAPGDDEWQAFVNALTTNLTSFWRESHHFPVLGRLLSERTQRGPATVWCCAASTGEEPVTIAITAIEAFGSRTPPVRVLATDIDTAVLANARAGVYREEAVAKLEPALVRRHFLRGRGRHAGFVRVMPDVLALIDYRPLNLLDERWSVEGAFDAIFCRNVMIYFDKPTQLRVLRRLVHHLAPDGLLFSGHSENLAHARDLLEPRGRTVYGLAAGHAHACVAARAA